MPNSNSIWLTQLAWDGGEVEDEPVTVPGVEIVPHGLRAMGVQVVPHYVHLPLG